MIPARIRGLIIAGRPAPTVRLLLLSTVGAGPVGENEGPETE